MSKQIQYTRAENAVGYTCLVLFVLALPWIFGGILYAFSAYLEYWAWVWVWIRS